MAEHRYTAVVEWARGEARFTDGRYGRGHRWLFDGGVEVPASSAPSSVPVPLSRPDAVDPEEAFVAALSSCHMLFCLDLAQTRGFVVDSYRDEASGVMTPTAAGKLFVSAVTLDPEIAFGGERRPDPADIAAMHHAAHAECYLANSVLTAVTVAGLEGVHA